LGAVDLVAHCKFQPAVIQHGVSLYRQFVLHTVTYRLTAGNHDRVSSFRALS
jgi:hypothetical protein